jgi:hypothetical protein
MCNFRQSIDSGEPGSLSLGPSHMSVSVGAAGLDDIVCCLSITCTPRRETRLRRRRCGRAVDDWRSTHGPAIGHVGALVLTGRWKSARTEGLNSSHVLGRKGEVHSLSRAWQSVIGCHWWRASEAAVQRRR